MPPDPGQRSDVAVVARPASPEGVEVDRGDAGGAGAGNVGRQRVTDVDDVGGASAGAAPARARAASKIRTSGLAAPTSAESITGTPANPQSRRFSSAWPSEFVTITTAKPRRRSAAIVSSAPGVGSLHRISPERRRSASRSQAASASAAVRGGFQARGRARPRKRCRRRRAVQGAGPPDSGHAGPLPDRSRFRRGAGRRPRGPDAEARSPRRRRGTPCGSRPRAHPAGEAAPTRTR